MSIHERMESIADLHAAGGLSADERREADEHAAACPSCASMLRDAREFSAWARGAIASDAPPADLEDRLVSRFRAAGQSKKRRIPVGKRFLKVTGSIAAAVGLILLGNFFSTQSGWAQLRSQSAAESEGRATWTKMDGDKSDVLNDGLALGLERQGKPAAGEELAYYFKRDLGREAHDRAKWGNLPDETRARLQDQLGIGGGGGGGGGGGRYGARFGGRNAESAAATETEKLSKLNESLEDDRRSLKDAKGDSDERRFGARENLVSRGGGARAVQPPPVQETRKIIRNGDVSLEVESYEATYAKLAELIAAEKGQIAAASTQRMANGKIQATVTLRVPPERFEAVLARLKEFGSVRNQKIGSEDVTKAYIDLETRLKGKEILAERLRKLLAEGKGSVKELMEVEVQLGATNEAIEQIKGELKYYDNLVGLSTITLRISEKDLGQPFEYVQSLQSNIALTAANPDDAYARAQKEIADAGGQVVDSKMTRQSDGSSVGTIRGRVDADKFPALREAIKKLGTVTNDTVNQQKTARGGHEGAPKPDAPLRKELAVVDVTVNSPPIFVTRRSQVLVETAAVDSAYQNARRAVEAAGGKVVDGSLTAHANGSSAVLKAQVDAEKFGALVDSFKTAGKVKNSNVQSSLPPVSPEGGPQLLRERAEIELALVSPPQLIGEEHGILKTVRDTLANSWAGLLWSIEKLFVGVSLAGPWVALLLAGWLLWRRARKKKAAQPAP
jgi:glycine cleavage system regulatory protein